MADRNLHDFQIRQGQTLGDRLVWRYPLASEDGRHALRGLPDAETVTVGYYRRVHPPGSVAFFPIHRPHSLAALTVPSVQRRIMDDLIRLNEAPE